MSRVTFVLINEQNIILGVVANGSSSPRGRVVLIL